MESCVSLPSWDPGGAGAQTQCFCQKVEKRWKHSLPTIPGSCPPVFFPDQLLVYSSRLEKN